VTTAYEPNSVKNLEQSSLRASSAEQLPYLRESNGTRENELFETRTDDILLHFSIGETEHPGLQRIQFLIVRRGLRKEAIQITF